MTEPQYTSIKRDSATDKIAVPFELVYGREAVAQRLRTRFHFFLREWFLDRRQGVPYYEHVLKKGFDKKIVRSIFRQLILRTPGVQRLTQFDLVFPTSSNVREATLDFECVLSDEAIFRSQPKEFVIVLPR